VLVAWLTSNSAIKESGSLIPENELFYVCNIEKMPSALHVPAYFAGRCTTLPKSGVAQCRQLYLLGETLF
jgi:hypothetical protein